MGPAAAPARIRSEGPPGDPPPPQPATPRPRRPRRSHPLTLSEAIRLAAEQGCELEPLRSSPGRYAIRAIAYDADPYELSESQLPGLSREEFLAEWIPERL